MAQIGDYEVGHYDLKSAEFIRACTTKDQIEAERKCNYLNGGDGKRYLDKRLA